MVPVEPNPSDMPIAKPGISRRATAWDSACQILIAGIMAMGMNDVHMAPLRMSARQGGYLKPSGRKTHILTDDLTMAAADGIKFSESGNGVIVSRGINGPIPHAL